MSDGYYGHTRLGALFYWYLYMIIPQMVRVAFNFQVFGAHNVPKKGGVILAVNHQSYVDPVIVGSGMRRPCQFMARSTLFRNPLFARLISALGAFPVERGQSDTKALRQYVDRVQAGGAVLMFPEGTRTRDGLLGEIKSGVGMLGARAQAPVVPTYIYGGFHVWPRNKVLPRQAKMSIYFAPPVATERRPDESKRDQQERIRSEVERALRAMEARALASKGCR